MTKPLRSWVAVKYGVDVNLTRADPFTGTVAIDRAPRKTSDFDRNAVEEAVRIRERVGGTVTAISVGSPAAREALRDALALGADEAVLITDPTWTQPDTRQAAKALAAFGRKTPDFDLWFFGEGSTDHFSGSLGPRVAAELAVPSLSYVRKLTVEDGGVLAERELERDLEQVRASYPAVITVGQEINQPRVPGFMAKLKATKKEIRQLSVTDLGGTTADWSSTVRLEKAFVPEVKRRQITITGADPAAQAIALLEALRKDEVIP